MPLPCGDKILPATVTLADVGAKIIIPGEISEVLFSLPTFVSAVMAVAETKRPAVKPTGNVALNEALPAASLVTASVPNGLPPKFVAPSEVA